MSQQVTRSGSIEEQERAREDGDKKPKSRRPASKSWDLINPLSPTNLYQILLFASKDWKRGSELETSVYLPLEHRANISLGQS